MGRWLDRLHEKGNEKSLENVIQQSKEAAAERNELRRFALKLVDEGKLTDLEFEDVDEAIRSDAYAAVMKLKWIKIRQSRGS